MPQLSLNIDQQTRGLVRGFNNTLPPTLPLSAFQGDTLGLFLRSMNPTGNAAAPYVDVDYSAAALQVGIGTIGAGPTSGSIPVVDSDTSIATTLNVAAGASAADVQAALRTLANWTLCTVTGNAGGPYIVTNGTNAARGLLMGGASTLVPKSSLVSFIIQAGSGTVPAIQQLELVCAPIAYQNTFTPYPAPTITVARVVAGGVSGSNEVQSVTLNNQPYAGSFPISFGGQTATFNATASLANVQAGLQALSSVGAGNVSVGGTPGQVYIITFTGTLGGASQSLVTSSADGLIGPIAMTGPLALNVAGIEEAIGESPSISAILEVKVTPAGGSSQVILQTPITILNDLIQGAPTVDPVTESFYTETESDGRYTQKGNNASDFANLVTTLSNLWKSLTTTAGAVLYMGAASTLTVLAPNTTGTQKFLSMTSSVPSWSTVAASLPPGLVKTANYTAVAGDEIKADTSGGVFTITLPAAPSIGDRVKVGDANASGGFGTHTLTIGRNGLKINGGTSDYSANVDGINLTCFYVSVAIGWSIEI